MNAAERAKLKDKELVDLKCNKCGSDYQLTFGRYRKIRKSGNFLCKTCMKQFHDEQVKKTWNSKSKEEMDRINDKKREAYNNKSEEEKQKQIGKMVEYNKNMSEEEKKLKHENLMKAKREYEDNLSEEEKFKRSQHASENMKNFWANVDDDYKTHRVSLLHEGNKEWWNNMTQEEQDAHMGLVHAGRDKWWAELSSEEKTDWVKNLSNQHALWWKLLTPEELSLISQRSSNNSKEYWNSLSNKEKEIINEKRRQTWKNKSNKEKEDEIDNVWKMIVLNCEPNKNELEFINNMKYRDINYNFQHRSQNIHPDFYSIFPINPFTGGFVSAKHTWDFLLHTKDKDILVDIDGGIHKKLYKNNNFNNWINFYDSQRIYQTDDLDAYVVKCYDDKISDNTPVENVKTKEIISFRQFVSLLITWNTSSKEIKQLLKNK